MKLTIKNIALLLSLFLILGCSPKTSHQVLSFFFDGVPDFSKKELNKGGNQNVALANNNLPQPVNPEGILKLHPPYEEKQCTNCHDNSAVGGFAMPQPALCNTCHPSFSEKFAWVHGPVASGYCTNCHYPHKSELSKLLKRKGQQICTTCHDLNQVLENKVHASIGNADCTTCHDPHGGTNRFILK